MCGDPSITYSIRPREGKTGSPGEGGEGRRKGGREEGRERGKGEGKAVADTVSLFLGA